MISLIQNIFGYLGTNTSLRLEVLALRHQVVVLKRQNPKRPMLRSLDRIFWVWLSMFWSDWRSALIIVQPKTVIKWHRQGFRLYWRWKSRCKKPGRKPVDKETRELIRRMSEENVLWGSQRILGELEKLGIEVGLSSVLKYMVKRRSPPSQTWKTFLKNHMHNTASMDFFVVPTITFNILYVLIIIHHKRRRLVHFNVTANPTAMWVVQQLREAFPWDTAPKYLIRDRDAIYGGKVKSAIAFLGIEEVLTAPQSPWQNPFSERVIGTIRHDALDHMIILNEDHLRRIMPSFLDYYHTSRTHMSLDRDSPESRGVQKAEEGTIISFPQVGGLHHRYERRKAA